MNWTRDKSILLSKICVILFAVLLAVLDVGCYWVVGLFGWLRRMTVQTEIGLMVTVYLCSVFGWLLLYRLWSLLGNLQKSEVFIEENVSSDLSGELRVLCALCVCGHCGGLYGPHCPHRQKCVSAGHFHEIRAGSDGLGGGVWKS